MDFEALIHPLPKQEFFDRFERGACFVIRSPAEKFTNLVDLQDIEDRLNDGCNIGSPVEIIRDGKRSPVVDTDLAWSSFAVKKAEVLDQIHARCSFMIPNMSQLNPRVAAMIDGIEQAFAEHDARADVHLYVSTTREASAYNAHRDYPQHKIYLQVIGSTEWHIFSHNQELPNDVCAVKEKDVNKNLKVVDRFTLNPGDLFYMPPSVFHQISNCGGPRVSLSIPVVLGSTKKRMDRTYIPFKSLFEAELAASNAR